MIQIWYIREQISVANRMSDTLTYNNKTIYMDNQFNKLHQQCNIIQLGKADNFHLQHIFWSINI